MNKIYLTIVLLFFAVCLQAQYSFKKILSIPYQGNENHNIIRKTDNGTYGPDFFAFSNSHLYLLYGEEQSIKIFDSTGSYKLRKSSPYNAASFDFDAGGGLIFNSDKFITAENNNSINSLPSECVFVTSRLTDRSFVFRKDNRRILIQTEKKTASVRFIGVDSKGNIFFDVETFVSEIPCKVLRHIFVYDRNDVISSMIKLPDIYYAYMPKDVFVDNDGNIYHLLSNKNELELIKWNPVRHNKAATTSEIDYPEEYSFSFHYNSMVNEHAIVSSPTPEPMYKTMVDRNEALAIADTYYRLEWTCQPINKSNGLVVAAGGKEIRTPDWVVVGSNKQMPYKWGGFSTINDFISGVANGKYAGDNNCTGYGSSAVVGVDCSGFVSRCWKLSSHYSTSMMPNIITPYQNWSELKPGDAIHKVGHVRLFTKHNNDGTLQVIEASGVDWRVAYRNYSYSNLQGYAPNKYKNMLEPATVVDTKTTFAVSEVKTYPNPFNGKVTFLMKSRYRSESSIEIFDNLGRIVLKKDIKLVNGDNYFSWNASGMNGESLSSGIYFYRIAIPGEKFKVMNKILLIR